MSTAGSQRPNTFDLPYAMAKAGLNALTLGLAGAYNPKVRVNTVMPGPFQTDVTKHWAPGTVERVNETNPMRRIGQPEDMVGVCVFLASDASSYVNGAQILVDGGSFRNLSRERSALEFRAVEALDGRELLDLRAPELRDLLRRLAEREHGRERVGVGDAEQLAQRGLLRARARR